LDASGPIVRAGKILRQTLSPGGRLYRLACSPGGTHIVAGGIVAVARV
jgi:hypothetical protein